MIATALTAVDDALTGVEAALTGVVPPVGSGIDSLPGPSGTPR